MYCLLCAFITFAVLLSLGVDSLSQSISSTSSATNAGYGARVIGYQDQIKNTLPTLISKYGGFTCSVL